MGQSILPASCVYEKFRPYLLAYLSSSVRTYLEFRRRLPINLTCYSISNIDISIGIAVSVNEIGDPWLAFKNTLIEFKSLAKKAYIMSITYPNALQFESLANANYYHQCHINFIVWYWA